MSLQLLRCHGEGCGRILKRETGSRCLPLVAQNGWGASRFRIGDKSPVSLGCARVERSPVLRLGAAQCNSQDRMGMSTRYRTTAITWPVWSARDANWDSHTRADMSGPNTCTYMGTAEPIPMSKCQGFLASREACQSRGTSRYTSEADMASTARSLLAGCWRAGQRANDSGREGVLEP